MCRWRQTGRETSFLMILTMVCISNSRSLQPLPEVRFYCHTDGYRVFPDHWAKSVERIHYLADRRNAANSKALELFPDTTHFFFVDSYYLSQVQAMRQLIDEYSTFTQLSKSECILGASTWSRNTAGIPGRNRYWDTWTNPEFTNKRPSYRPPAISHSIPKNWEKTSGAGGFSIYPRWVWEKQGYGVPSPFPESGCEHNYLSRCPNIDTFVTFNTLLWHDFPDQLKFKPLNYLRKLFHQAKEGIAP